MNEFTLYDTRMRLRKNIHFLAEKSIQTNSEFGHLEIDLMIEKKFINEAVLLTFLEE